MPRRKDKRLEKMSGEAAGYPDTPRPRHHRHKHPQAPVKARGGGRGHNPAGGRSCLPVRSRAEWKAVAEDTMATLDPTHASIASTITYMPDDLPAAAAKAKANAAAATAAAVGGAGRTAFEVRIETTLQACRRLAEKPGAAKPPCALNFASARNPGGGFLRGSAAQEEALCRSSGLYLAIKDSPVYKLVREKGNARCLYYNTVIYSPGVPVLKDDRGHSLRHPYAATFLTCPAPNAKEARKHGVDDATVAAALRQRILAFLVVAAAHGERQLVLGAFGCGVFGNDIDKVAECFAQLLWSPKVAGWFDEVVFAVVDERSAAAFSNAFKIAVTDANGDTEESDSSDIDEEVRAGCSGRAAAIDDAEYSSEDKTDEEGPSSEGAPAAAATASLSPRRTAPEPSYSDDESI